MFGIEGETTSSGDSGLTAAIARLRALDGMEVKAGLFGGFAARKAMWQEYGTSRGIPSRPFLRNTQYEYSARWAVFIGPLVATLLSGGSPKAIAEQLGQLMEHNIKTTIAAGGFAPLAPATIKAKGHSKLLIDTGDMYGSVTHKVGG